MDNKCFEDSIVIVRDKFKSNFIRKLRKDEKLLNVKVMGINEFKKKYYFDYDKESIYKVKEKYSVVKSVAEMYVENLYFIDEIEDEKINFLKEIKEYLISQNVLKIDEEFKEYIKNKKIILYNLKYLDKFYQKMFKEVSKDSKVIEISQSVKEESKKSLVMCPNKESEISYVASEIIKLIKNGVDINQIKISNIDNYVFPLKIIFRDFNIPLELDSRISISSTLMVKKFKELFSNNMTEVLENLKEYVKTKRDEKIYKIIVDVVNEYYWCDNYLNVKDFIFSDLDAEKIPINKYKNAIRVLDFLEDEVDDETYVFLLNFNLGVIPKIMMDEDYINDELKRQMSLSDSVDINKKRILNVQENIKKIKNLVVTYSTQDVGNELYISNAYNDELFDNKKIKINFCNSHRYNKSILIKEKDKMRKFGIVSSDYLILNNYYKDFEYMNYNNNFKGIKKENLNKFFNNKLVLSYSSMNTFYHCAFRYYLENIIKINDYEDTFEIVVGNIMHHILSRIENQNFDVDLEWEKEVSLLQIPIGDKEKFFLRLLKDELKFILDYIEEQRENTDLSKALYEKKIEVNFTIDEKEILFKGFIDKILYNNIDGKLITAIIDYKTGNPEINLDNSYHGLDMQLPIYAYLVRHCESLKDAIIGGFYLEKILTNEKNVEKKKSNLKLQGYSNQNINILSHVDKTYEDSKMIKSMKVTSNGLASYAKVLSDENVDRLCDIVEEKILNAAKDILDGKFEINPKEIDNKLVGCSFCKYSDICFKNAKNNKKIERINAKDFLGGDDHAKLD